MPTYTYQCYECGHRFEKICSASKRTDVLDCTSCSQEAEQLVPRGVQHSFVLESRSDLPTPQNTGVASYDYEVDRIVAGQARERQAFLKQRDAHKRGLLRAHPDADTSDVARDVDGNYIVVPRKVKTSNAHKRAYAEAVKQKAQAFLGESGQVVEHDAHLYRKG